MDFRLFFLWVSLVSCHIYCNNFVSNPSASSLPSRVSCYLPLQPFQAIKLHKQSIGFMHIFTLLQESLLLQNDGFNIFNIIIVHWPNSAYLYLQRFVHLQIVSGLICSFRKDILLSIICCRVVIIYGEAKLWMDCYIIASTLGGGVRLRLFERHRLPL